MCSTFPKALKGMDSVCREPQAVPLINTRTGRLYRNRMLVVRACLPSAQGVLGSSENAGATVRLPTSTLPRVMHLFCVICIWSNGCLHSLASYFGWLN